MGKSDQTLTRAEGVAGWAMCGRTDDPRTIGGARQIAYSGHGFSVERRADITPLDLIGRSARKSYAAMPLSGAVPLSPAQEHCPIQRVGSDGRLVQEPGMPACGAVFFCMVYR